MLDRTWAQWPVPNARSYDTSVADVVIDNVTGLMWQRAVERAGANPRSFIWSAALTYCADFSLAGYSDWRLPTRIELVSLIDPGRVSPAIDTLAFPSTPNALFWTSSPMAGNPAQAWSVYFGYGGTGPSAVDLSGVVVRCVRLGRADAPPGHYTLTSEVVTDTKTGLVWQRLANSQTYFFEQAQTYCADLVLGGQSDWRAPSLLELQTLVDESSTSPAIDPTAFPNTTSDYFWTSSLTINSAPQAAWVVRFSDGYSYWYDVSNALYAIRCVR